ncbi:DUF6114 domain-containing protein [Streptomyces sp. NPDC004539]|uniref:DUF6114 domain-containing protein n=1 Tax=Streptomyces sp. NPDC004539 TaxID=3154280 RepID=UPI0033A5E9A2
MSAISAAPGLFARGRSRFKVWRGTRPFWAGLYVMLSGFPIMYFPYAHLQIGHLTVAMATTAGAGSLIIGVLLVTLGISLWFQQHIRTFAGVAAILLALVSLPVSNFGGFVVGFLLALFGGAMAVSWVPGKPVEETAGEPVGEAPEQTTAQESAPADDETPRVAAEAPETEAAVAEPKDLSGTSPANGSNGRRSAD